MEKQKDSAKLWLEICQLDGDYVSRWAWDTGGIDAQVVYNRSLKLGPLWVIPIKALERVGADIVRVSVPTMDAAEAFKLIKQQVRFYVDTANQ